ncbi:MAG: peptidoglycan bridge formation glycyltransferase FemA/FemB family protein [Flavobacteriales bacterium]|nr:peptidoglycan bridge formation glycyltransferase FemA/FemB family protein [Flavobacteriales bacterium]
MNNEMKVVEIENINDYKLLVDNSTTALWYHSLEYAQLIEKHLTAKLIVFGIYSDGTLLGAIPFVGKNHKLGLVMNSFAYYGSNGGIIVHDEHLDKKAELYSEFFQFFKQWCKMNEVVSYTIISNPLDSFSSKCMHNEVGNYTDQRVGQITSIPNFSESISDDLLELFDSPRPRNIRKAIKSSVQVSYSNDISDLKFLYTTHVANIEAIGGIPKKWDFFEKLTTLIPHHFWRVYLAKVDGKSVSALLLFFYNNTVEYFTPATVHEYRNLQPSALINFEAMKDSAKMGFRYWNWGGTWFTQEGVYNFKKKWGAEDYNYEYYTQILDEKVYRIPKEELLTNYYGIYVVSFDKLIS